MQFGSAGSALPIAFRRSSCGRRMAISNSAIAALLRNYASVLAIEGVDRFKIKAYRRAAETIETTGEKMTALVARGESLQALPGIGVAISKKIEEIIRSGKLPQLDRSVAKLTPQMAELAAEPAIDPKAVLRVYKKLGIGSLKELRERLESGEIRAVFGARTEFILCHGLDKRPRMLLWAADKFVPLVLSYLRSSCGVTQIEPIGSLRRRQDTVADLGFLVTGRTANEIFDCFGDFGAVQSFEKHGSEAVYRLSEGRTIRLLWTVPSNWGLALIEQTGSKAHLAELKALAKKKKRPLTRRALGAAAATETQIYSRLGLAFIPPEVREGRGELLAAGRDELPELIEVQDLRGDLHMHTDSSDGSNTLLEMAEAAAKRGYRYIAITDHSQSLKITNGLTEKRLFQQIRAIDKLNAKLKGITLLKSAEVDILEDGSLDYSDAALKELDLTICSIHSRFALDKQRQTERILRHGSPLLQHSWSCDRSVVA